MLFQDNMSDGQDKNGTTSFGQTSPASPHKDVTAGLRFGGEEANGTHKTGYCKVTVTGGGVRPFFLKNHSARVNLDQNDPENNDGEVRFWIGVAKNCARAFK